MGSVSPLKFMGFLIKTWLQFCLSYRRAVREINSILSGVSSDPIPYFPSALLKVVGSLQPDGPDSNTHQPPVPWGKKSVTPTPHTGSSILTEGEHVLLLLSPDYWLPDTGLSEQAGLFGAYTELASSCCVLCLCSAF